MLITEEEPEGQAAGIIKVKKKLGWPTEGSIKVSAEHGEPGKQTAEERAELKKIRNGSNQESRICRKTLKEGRKDRSTGEILLCEKRSALVNFQ